MARLIIKKYKNNNDKSAAYGKTYGRLVHQDTMNTSDLCRHMMKHGTFYLSANTEGVIDEKDFSANNVKAIHVRFLPDQSKESEYTAKMLTSKAKFRSVNGEAMPGAEEGEGENNG